MPAREMVVVTPQGDGKFAVAGRLEAAGRGGDSLSERARALGLTGREVEVLGWIREGKSNPEIGIILGISPRTVQKHVEHLLGKLGAETRHAAACQALLWRWDDGPARGDARRRAASRPPPRGQ